MMNRLMKHDDSKQDSEDLDTTSRSSASSDHDMNYSSAQSVRPPVFRHAEKVELAGMVTPQRFRHAPPVFAPLPLIVHRPVVPVEFSAGEPRGSAGRRILLFSRSCRWSFLPADLEAWPRERSVTGGIRSRWHARRT